MRLTLIWSPLKYLGYYQCIEGFCAVIQPELENDYRELNNINTKLLIFQTYYCISSNKHRVSNKYLSLISTAPLYTQIKKIVSF